MRQIQEDNLIDQSIPEKCIEPRLSENCHRCPAFVEMEENKWHRDKFVLSLCPIDFLAEQSLDENSRLSRWYCAKHFCSL